MDSIINNTDLILNSLIFSCIIGSILGGVVGLIGYYINKY